MNRSARSLIIVFIDVLPHPEKWLLPLHIMGGHPDATEILIAQ